MLLQVAMIWALVVAPVGALMFGALLGSALVGMAGAAAMGMHLGFSLSFSYGSRGDIPILLMFPAGMLLITLMLLRAGFQCLGNDGIDWRGTHYPLKQLRAGQRVKFFHPLVRKR
jgi:hypothetical protein